MSQSENVVRTIIDLANRYEVDAIQEHLMDDMTFVNPVTGPTGKSGMELFHEDCLPARFPIQNRSNFCRWPVCNSAVPSSTAGRPMPRRLCPKPLICKCGLTSVSWIRRGRATSGRLSPYTLRKYGASRSHLE